MNRWQQVEQLYHSVLEREVSQRAAFLEEACAGDKALRREVESLLAQQRQAESFMETPALEVGAKPPAQANAQLLVGRQIGSHKILSLLGSGGMGQVYRARDAKLGRDVAIKVLPREFSSDPERVRRFGLEARAASALNHPNIITIHEIGQVDAVHYMVMELVEGKTLREILAAGPVPIKRILHLSTQVADGLAKAHAAGITHRDLKPENLMITKDGLVKILDFGLAKQLVSRAGEGSGTVTLADVTEPGVLLGTVGYMSPEQAKTQAVNCQSDQFSFGAIVYEMVTGERAFACASAAETLSAIIREEPKALAELSPQTPIQLRWIIERCLAKDAEDRYASTRDLARELQVLRDHLSEVAASDPTLTVASPSTGTRRWLALAGIGLVVAVLAALAGAFFQGRSGREPPPTFHRLTFRHGDITGARFAPDGQTIIYGATFGAQPSELYTTRLESPESKSVGLHDAGIFSISSSGEMAFALGCTLNWSFCTGTLARVPLTGGAPREILQKVTSADWAPDGNALAVARFEGTRCRLEYPVGKLLYETSGWINFVRVSPKGNLIAFLDYSMLGDIAGSVCVMDLTGKKGTVSAAWKGIHGLAWSAAGDEIWFTGSRVSTAAGMMALHAVTLAGQERLIYDGVLVRDISRDGQKVLLSRDTPRAALMSLTPGSTKEHDLAWFDFSTAADLSADGRTLLFDEWGEAARGIHTVYLRKTDGSDPVRLGEGKPLALSPDGKWALAVQQTVPQQLVFLPTGPGEQRSLPRGPIQEYRHWAAWSPDGSRVFFSGVEAGHRPRTYVQDTGGGEPRPVTSDGMVGVLLSPDGRLIAALGRYNEYYLCPVEGGEPRAIDGILEDDISLLQWSSDGRSFFVRGAGELVLKIYKLDLVSGRRELWKELTPPDPAALIDIGSDIGEVRITPDGKSYVYTSWTVPSVLYVVEGLR